MDKEVKDIGLLAVRQMETMLSKLEHSVDSKIDSALKRGDVTFSIGENGISHIGRNADCTRAAEALLRVQDAMMEVRRILASIREMLQSDDPDRIAIGHQFEAVGDRMMAASEEMKAASGFDA